MCCPVPTPCSPGPRQQWGPCSPAPGCLLGLLAPSPPLSSPPVSPQVLAPTRAVFSLSVSPPLARRRRRAPHVSVSFPFLLLAPSFPAPFPLSLRPDPLSASSYCPSPNLSRPHPCPGLGKFLPRVGSMCPPPLPQDDYGLQGAPHQREGTTAAEVGWGVRATETASIDVTRSGLRGATGEEVASAP